MSKTIKLSWNTIYGTLLSIVLFVTGLLTGFYLDLEPIDPLNNSINDLSAFKVRFSEYILDYHAAKKEYREILQKYDSVSSSPDSSEKEALRLKLDELVNKIDKKSNQINKINDLLWKELGLTLAQVLKDDKIEYRGRVLNEVYTVQQSSPVGTIRFLAKTKEYINPSEVSDVLEKVKYSLGSSPDKSVLLSGYNDGDSRNKKDLKLQIELSEKRVKAIADELVSMGVARQRIITRGYGTLIPIDKDNLSNDINRRVEVRLIASDALK